MSKVRASHLLVKHQGSRRPASWKDPDGVLITKRTQADAINLLNQYRTRIVNNEISFADLARTESDCSSAKHGGDLGLFGKGEMQPSFEEAAFSLKVGELSQIVHSDSGSHLILRTA